MKLNDFSTAKLCLILASMVFISTAQARPISYVDGVTVMQTNSEKNSKLHVHYSPSIKDSFGVTAKRVSASDNADNSNGTDYKIGGQWNHLLYRKNTEDSQANLYSKTEIEHNVNNTNSWHSSLEVTGDWETRRAFSSYGAKLDYDLSEKKSQFSHNARIGVAPYIADYNELHTWLMVQVDSKPKGLKSEQLVVTPLVRLFKGDYLVELGMNQEKEVLFNWTVRY